MGVQPGAVPDERDVREDRFGQEGEAPGDAGRPLREDRACGHRCRGAEHQLPAGCRGGADHVFEQEITQTPFFCFSGKYRNHCISVIL